VRPPDDEIPSTELLYRRLRAEHVDGDRVLEDAIDSEGTSCDRAKYRSDPRELISPAWPRVGAVAVGAVPVNLRPPTQPGAPTVVWEFFVVDAPTEANEAHAEIRVRRESKRPSTKNDDAIKKKPDATRAWLKSKLADELRVVPL
jgi:hypothetical protein